MISTLIAAVAVQAGPSPYTLPIGDARQTTLQFGQLVDLRSLKPATPDDIARAAESMPFVFLGESHTSPEHHVLQAKVIEALVKAGRHVVVGFEMFTRPKQDSLDPWTMRFWDEAEFVQKSEWKTQWGYPFELYRPIFEAVRRYQLPMVAMNVPRDWVRSVGKSGYSVLSAEQRSQLPADLFLGDKPHRSIFDAMMGGHPMTGVSMENAYSAQVLWDEGMADTAIKYIASRPFNSKNVFVVIAGSGHAMYKRGINLRVWRRTGMEGVTVSMIDADGPTAVSRGIGDFAYLTPTPKSPGG